jgi:hypothetical protein
MRDLRAIVKGVRGAAGVGCSWAESRHSPQTRVAAHLIANADIEIRLTI